MFTNQCLGRQVAVPAIFLSRFGNFSSDFVCVVLLCRKAGAPRAPFGREPGLLRTKALPMSHVNEPRDAVRRHAQSHFTHTERRDELVRHEIEKERAAVDAKTAKLRALRLAKEASEQAEAERLAAERAKSGVAAPKPAGRRKRPV